MNILSDFTWKERFYYADVNAFLHLSPALRYYDFLLIILDRYTKVNQKVIALHGEEMKLTRSQPGIRRVTPEQARRMDKSSRLTTRLHLEIESFYLFAKILLDNIARFIYVYFGEERGIGLESHHALAKHHKKYFEAKGLVVPDGLSESLALLEKEICDYRDKEISHELSLRRIRGTAWGGSGAARIAAGVIYPHKGDKMATSAELPQLMSGINNYIRQVITLIGSNRNKSRFELKSQLKS